MHAPGPGKCNKQEVKESWSKKRKNKIKKKKADVIVSPMQRHESVVGIGQSSGEIKKKKVKMQMYREPPEYGIDMRGKIRR